MSKTSRRGLRLTAAAAGAGVIAAAAWATAGHAGPASAATSPANSAVTSTTVKLHPMPRGTITFGKDSKGNAELTVNAFGLTPGSSHEVQLMKGNRAVVTFTPLTANSLGQVRDETLDSRYPGTLGSLRVAMLEGNGGAKIALLEIARTASYASARHIYRLIPVEAGVDGKNWGTPKGSAVISYDRAAKTISVTVNAIGLEPGVHAADIQAGSCVAQGPARPALMDFTANAKGQIVQQTQKITGVTTAPPAAGWYFSLHQGNSGDILANGSPTINFRPLLCGGIATKG